MIICASRNSDEWILAINNTSKDSCNETSYQIRPARMTCTRHFIHVIIVAFSAMHWWGGAGLLPRTTGASSLACSVDRWNSMYVITAAILMLFDRGSKSEWSLHSSTHDFGKPRISRGLADALLLLLGWRSVKLLQERVVSRIEYPRIACSVLRLHIFTRVWSNTKSGWDQPQASWISLYKHKPIEPTKRQQKQSPSTSRQ